ncbi:C-C motif chemokine 3-like isoform X1 [Dasypus novemcinctus]|uniref:C-C motif chemokine 3-like isoform X1 n=1 Tax=Dasypus novemcinctus TaxID=9361 RepID=UPI000328BA7A|nr:C-C motif chemokine 3-like isoform X1 [Dasypus novemcinctus]
MRNKERVKERNENFKEKKKCWLPSGALCPTSPLRSSAVSFHFFLTLEAREQEQLACLFFWTIKEIMIPRKFVDDYYETSSQCSKPGVIFQTKRGRQICANPDEAWVQKYITDLELNA